MVDYIAQKIAESKKSSQEATNFAISSMQSSKACLRDSLEVLKAVRETLTDEDEIKDCDAAIAETQDLIARFEAE